MSGMVHSREEKSIALFNTSHNTETQKRTYCVIPFVWYSKPGDANHWWRESTYFLRVLSSGYFWFLIWVMVHYDVDFRCVCLVLWYLILMAWRRRTSIYFPDVLCDSAGKVSACNAGDLALIPGLGRSPGKGKATHSSILAWRIPWTV